MPVDEFFKIEQKGKGRRTRWNVLRYRIVHGLEVKAKEEAENAQPFQRQAEAAVFLNELRRTTRTAAARPKVR
jgi:hypothetical protein